MRTNPYHYFLDITVLKNAACSISPKGNGPNYQNKPFAITETIKAVSEQLLFGHVKGPSDIHEGKKVLKQFRYEINGNW